MAALVASIPLQLMCQLVVTGPPSTTEKFTLAQPAVYPASSPPPQIQSTILPNGYIAYPFAQPAVYPASSPPPQTQSTILPNGYITYPLAQPTVYPTSSPPPQIQSTILPNGYIAYPDVGAAYKIYGENVLWKEARRLCISDGGSLAVIDSVKKFEYISHQRQTVGVTHVGIHNLFDDDEWVSVKTGLPVKNIPWAPGEPNGRSHCAMVKHQTGGLGNFDCTTARGDFICEIPIPDEYPVKEKLLLQSQLVAN